MKPVMSKQMNGEKHLNKYFSVIHDLPNIIIPEVPDAASDIATGKMCIFRPPTR